jgi:glycosyltransferase involved in cell wall biosynthesis
MKSLPLVTVIIPTYNYEKYIVEAIESVLSSDYPQSCIEIIVVDDGSTDNTADLVQKCYNSKVKYIYINNSKKVGAVKLGLSLANGKYIFNLDADDLFEAQKIRTVVNIFESDPEIVHVSHVNQYWDVNSGHTKLEQIPPYLLGKKIDGNDALIYLYRRKLAYGAGSTYAGRADVIKGKLTFTDGIGTIVDEYLAIATMTAGYSYFIGIPLTKYRRHGRNDSMSHIEIFIDYVKAVEQQVKSDSTFSNEFKALYILKAMDLSLHIHKIEQKDTLPEIFRLYRHLILNTRLFRLKIFMIIWCYGLFKYLIPTPIFLFTRNILRQSFLKKGKG